MKLLMELFIFHPKFNPKSFSISHPKPLQRNIQLDHNSSKFSLAPNVTMMFSISLYKILMIYNYIKARKLRSWLHKKHLDSGLSHCSHLARISLQTFVSSIIKHSSPVLCFFLISYQSCNNQSCSRSPLCILLALKYFFVAAIYAKVPFAFASLHRQICQISVLA